MESKLYGKRLSFNDTNSSTQKPSLRYKLNKEHKRLLKEYGEFTRAAIGKAGSRVKKFTRKHYGKIIVQLIFVALTILANVYATANRGYWTVGGEPFLLVIPLGVYLVGKPLAKRWKELG